MRPYPNEGEVFEMTGDFDINTPEKLIEALGRTGECLHEGIPLIGIKKAKFKLLRAGGYGVAISPKVWRTCLGAMEPCV
ncbi:MAG: hypothetical protein A3J54_00970 [Candidatus Ryanbacteria bacterium RIFCSPHIGHO2_02_FULL_45_13b]|uniref:Uncharacterized protein n=1 Tax=Candidatus Ryanbacteria bacterium RIFCSPHIGHO2_02_FULL_45_13b TaxID=1802117 RepID=A0A1G2G8Q9_9BACT|nr:MAG: hypothetical protein A3J54_00970 [Candidatus Ryanbacteria bacterium RIFCSPHIGHO2_02_FULL_45_13b]